MEPGILRDAEGDPEGMRRRSGRGSGRGQGRSSGENYIDLAQSGFRMVAKDQLVKNDLI